MPEDMHGWAGIPPVEPDGQNWPLAFAAKMLDIPEKDLRDLVRIAGLAPAGVLNMRTFSTSGRTPRAYPAEKLIALTEAIRTLREGLNFPD